jgi:hypothetical protein
MNIIAYAFSRSRSRSVHIPGITVVKYSHSGGIACMADSDTDPGTEPDGSLDEVRADAILHDLGYVRCTAWQYTGFGRWTTDVEPCRAVSREIAQYPESPAAQAINRTRAGEPGTGHPGALQGHHRHRHPPGAGGRPPSRPAPVPGGTWPVPGAGTHRFRWSEPR